MHYATATAARRDLANMVKCVTAGERATFGGAADDPHFVVHGDLVQFGIRVPMEFARERWTDILDVALHFDRTVIIMFRDEPVAVLQRLIERHPAQDIVDMDSAIPPLQM